MPTMGLARYTAAQFEAFMTGSAHRLLRIVTLAIATLALAPYAFAQSVQGVILDQSGLPITGATIQLVDGTTQVATTTSGGDGTFTIEAGTRGTSVVVAIEGFETKTVARADAAKIVLEISKLTDSAT